MQFIWAALGLVCVALALIGVALPLLPTVPFLLLAAFFFARSSERLHTWLVTHRLFGPMILDWQQSGAIRPGAKKGGNLVDCRRVWPVTRFRSPLARPADSGRGAKRGSDLYLDPP
jgi:hypothetical protein